MKQLFFLLLLISVASLFSQEIFRMEKFADKLMQDEEYYRAITEYKRINSYFPDNTNYIKNISNISRCYYLAAHYIESINSYKNILKIEPKNKDAIFNIVKTYSQISYFYESNDEIKKYIYEFNGEERDELLLYSAFNNINLKKYDEAIIQLDSIKSIDLQQKSMNFKELIIKNTPLKYKKRSTAVLSGILIPGSGYFYTKRYGTGFASLIVNSILFYMTYDCFTNDRESLGIMSGVFFTSFYLGSIYGSIQVVNDYNKEIQINFTKQFKI